MIKMLATQSESANLRREVQHAWGRHLGQYLWTHWVTLTSRFGDTTPRQLQRRFRDKFIRRLARHAQRPVPWFAATERGAAGRIHVHALIYAKLPEECVKSLWDVGRADVQQFDPDRGAAFYLAKWLHLPDDDFERIHFSRRMPPHVSRAA